MPDFLGSQTTYGTLALYVGGNALAFGAGVILFLSWRILASFQEPILWALLCALALRDVKDRLTQFLDSQLKSRTMLEVTLNMLLLLCAWFLKPLATIFHLIWKHKGDSDEGTKVPQSASNMAEGSQPQGATDEPVTENSGFTSECAIGIVFRAVILLLMKNTLYQWLLQCYKLCGEHPYLAAIALGALVLFALHLQSGRGNDMEQAQTQKDPHMSTEIGSDAPPRDSRDTEVAGEEDGGGFSSSALGLPSWDKRLRDSMRSNRHSLVALMLMASVVTGSVLGSGFLAYRVVCETQTAVVKFNDLITEAQENAEIGEMWQLMIGYQGDILHTLQASLPDVSEVAWDKVEGYLVANNLSHAAGDVKELYGVIIGHFSSCTEDRRVGLMVNVAAARASMSRVQREHNAKLELLQVQQNYLQANLTAWNDARKMCMRDPDPAKSLPSDSCIDQDGEVVESDKLVRATKITVNDLARNLDAAQEALKMAELKLDQCEAQAGEFALWNDIQHSMLVAWEKLLHLDVSGAFSEFYSIIDMTGAGSVSLTSLQQSFLLLAKPLFPIGQALVQTAARTTNLIVSSGATLLRIGLLLINFLFEALLFLSILYYLLAAEQDPFLQVIQLLPVSEQHRHVALTGIGDAIQSVFFSTVKLATFHSLFTWLSLTLFGVEMACLMAILSTVLAVLPYLPTFLVSLPGAMQLVFQGCRIKAFVLVATHIFANSYVNDMVMKEIPGVHSSLLALGVIGGMYSFNNPLQGAIIGPMILALLSVFYKLHFVFLKSGDGADEEDPTERGNNG